MYTRENKTINGVKYKRVIKIEVNKKIWQKDVPLVTPGIHASGLHIIFQNPDNDHFDHICAGSTWRKYLNQDN